MRKILKKNKIKPFRVFDENNLSSLPRIILSSVLVISFFYSLPIVINFTTNKIESSAGIQNNSKAILAYTLNKKSSNSSNSLALNIFSSIRFFNFPYEILKFSTASDRSPNISIFLSSAISILSMPSLKDT